MRYTSDSYCETLLEHFPKKISKTIVDYANNEALKFSRYIFTRREGKKQYGYCTHCKSEFITNGIRHNKDIECPMCKSFCIVKASGLGRSTMVDEAYFVYYEKSILNPKSIVARGIYTIRDYTGDYKKVETEYSPVALYVFEMGNSRSTRRYAYHNSYGELKAGSWEKCKSIFSESTRDHMANIPSSCSLESIKEAVKNTPYSYSCWELYLDRDMVKFFDLYTKYPCIEYLTKLGLQKLVEGKLNGVRTYSAINWRGKNLLKVLKLNKQELNIIKEQNIHVTFLSLKIYQMGKKQKSNLSIKEATKISDSYGYYIDDIKELMDYGSLSKINNYLIKQHKKDSKNFYSESSAFITWRDYIQDCIKLEMNLMDERVIFPNKLYNAHQNTIKQIQIQADERLNEEISKRLKTLQRYCFKHKGLIIRPAQSTDELIAEGKALSHCVGTYADSYAKGKKDILLIRQASKPDKPFFTVEIIKNDIRQVRGKKNCSPNNTVEKFMEVFKKKKLTISKNKTKMNISA